MAGLHRLEACRRLGMVHIDARLIDLDETERRLWEIAENLHRAELSSLERSEQIAQWIRLCEQRIQPAQVEPPEFAKAIGYKSPPRNSNAVSTLPFVDSALIGTRRSARLKSPG